MLGAFFSHYILVGQAVGPYSYEDNFQQPFGLQQNLCILSWVPENNIFSMSSLRTCPLLTLLKRHAIPTLCTVNSQLAASQFSSVPTFTLFTSCVYIRAGPVALGADAGAHLLYPTTSIWPRVQKCPFKNATYGILQTSKTASATLAFSTSGYAISEGNMLPCCFHIHTVVTPSVSATWVVW